MCRGGVTGQGKFPKKMWFFGRFSEQRAKKNSAQINRYNWHFCVPYKLMWFPRNGNSRLFSELSYLTSISLKCKLCPMQSYDPWQVLTFATSAKVPPDQFLLIHSQVYLCLCYRHTTPKYPLWLIWGGGSFLTCSQSGKAASENSKSSREDLYRCTLPTGTRKSIVRSKCTSEWKDISHKQLKHIGVRQIAEIQRHFVTSQILSIWRRPSGIYGIPVVHKNIWLPQCWRRDSYIFNVAVFTCVPC